MFNPKLIFKYTHVGASNVFWRVGQTNSDLVGLIKILVNLPKILGGQDPLFGQANQKMMKIEATKFSVNAALKKM